MFIGEKDLSFWRELAAILEDFLFNEMYVCESVIITIV